MNHRHRKVLHALYDHPLSANVDFKKVEAMLRELGAEIDTRTGARIGVSLNGQSGVFHQADYSLTKDEVVRLRHFLTECGIDPAKYPV